MSIVRGGRPRLASRWQSFESWVGTWRSAAALFAVALAVFALQSVALPVGPGRDMGRYVQTYLQFGYDEPVLASVLNSRGPLSALGVGVPLELGGVATEAWLAMLFAASILAWSAVALKLGPRAAVLTASLLLVNPSYGILFHGLASDALFAAGFAGWALLMSRAIVAPSIRTFLLAGAAMGGLVLIRPGNQVLIVFVLLPVLLSAPWRRRMEWVAAFFVGSAAVTQGWKALMSARFGDAVALRPSGAVLIAALLLLPLLIPSPWRRRLVLLAIPLLVAVVVVNRPTLHDPVYYARSLVQSPPSSVFLFRAFEIDRIVSPDNGPASQELARVVERDLLTKEPYRSYAVDLDDVFTSGSDRIFGDVTGLAGTDLEAVTQEAIRTHRSTFAKGIARTFSELLRARLIASASPPAANAERSDSGEKEFVVVNGRRLPRPSEGQPIPASHFGPVIHTLWGDAREVWRSATVHEFVFDDPRDERRYETFERETAELAGRIPTHDAKAGLAHRLNQASRVFPLPIFWLVLGLVTLALRRPRRALVALAPAVAGLVVIAATSLVAFGVHEYAMPVTPAFILLAAAGLVGAQPRRPIRLPWRQQLATSDSTTVARTSEPTR